MCGFPFWKDFQKKNCFEMKSIILKDILYIFSGTSIRILKYLVWKGTLLKIIKDFFIKYNKIKS